MRTRIVRGTLSDKTTDLTGRRFGRLAVESFAGYYHASGERYACWNCQCDCGSRKIIRGGDFTSGRTVSCGCYKDKRVGERSRTHRMSWKKEWRAWVAMKNRCSNPAAYGAHNYCGRGISMHPSWKKFEAFFRDVGPAPSRLHTLDRIDTNGNYEPGNVRWATATEQGRNRRNNRLLTYGGETLTATEWAERLGCRMNTICARLNIGWTVGRAVTTPVRKLTRH